MSGPGAAPTVALVIVNHRSAGLTDALLSGSAGGADEIVVVDCTPGEPGLAEVVARHGGRLVDPGENLGYGGGANLGASVVRADVVVVANPDVEIGGRGLRSLAALARGVGLVAPRFVFPDGRLQPSAHRGEPRLLLTLWDLCVPWAAIATRVGRGWNPTLLSDAAHDEARDVVHVLGALMAIDAGALREVGGFDPGFFLYREETDLCRRLRAAGWRVRHEPSVTAVHQLHGATPGAGGRAPSDQELRSHYRYIRKHWGRPLAALARAVGALGAAVTVITGPDRRSFARALRWHLRGR